VLRFRPLDTRGRPTGAAISLAASAGLPSSELLIQPSGAGFLVAWHQAGKELRLLRVGTDGTSNGSAASVMLSDTPNLVSMAALKGRIGLVYSDSGYRGDDPSDQMGLHEVSLSLTDLHLVSDSPASPWDRSMPRFGAATWLNDRLVRVYLEDKTLKLASGSGAKAPTEVLSKASGGTFGMWPSNDGKRALLTWSDERDDDLAKCAPSNCVAEAYVAVVDEKGSVVVAPTRATKRSVGEAMPIHREGWEKFCPK
jgi:hypothetical protein